MLTGLLAGKTLKLISLGLTILGAGVTIVSSIVDGKVQTSEINEVVNKVVNEKLGK